MSKDLTVTDEHRAAAATYPVTVRPDEVDGGFVAEVPDWPTIIGSGDTPDEAVAEAVEFVAAAVAWAAEEGRSAPAPLASYSGALQLRLPASLHRAVAQRAAAEGTTINATVVMLLAGSLGADGTLRLPRPRRRKAVPQAAGER
jgi:antitoxin HicB